MKPLHRAGCWAALGLVLTLGIAACGQESGTDTRAEPTAPPTIVTTPALATPSRSAAQTATPTPTANAAPSNLVVSVWWPDELYPADGSLAEDILLNQFDGFTQTYSTYDLEVRRKRTNGLGGILSTLRTAQPVAPGALPDLTLMRRSDMVAAATEGLIVPLGNWVPSELVGENLLPVTRSLGEINGVLYGVPYGISLYYNAYRASVLEEPLLTFESVLDADPGYLFPGDATTVNQTVLLQYTAAGGRLADETGQPVLDSDSLLTVYEYYATGVAQGIFGVWLLDYNQVSDYWERFASGEINMVAVDTRTHLANRDEVQNIGLAPVPTRGGTPITAIDGWLWVLTTQDPDRQQQARAFLSWMMRINQQSVFSEELGLLPSQARALRLWDDQAYADFAQSLIQSAVVIPYAQRNSSAALALQAGFAAVLDGVSASAAADIALGQLAS